jgi:hypothetical protein
MKKSFSRKTVFKNAGVLLTVTLMVLSSIVVTAAQKQNHDVGVTEIISPTTGPLQSYPVEIRVKNYGQYSEYTDVQVIIKSEDGLGEYADLAEDISVSPGGEVVVSLSPWYPSDLGMYNLTACTLLADENSSNDCLTDIFYITIDYMGFEVAPLGNAELAIVNESLEVSNCISGENETDGVWVNLENTGNWYTTWLEYPPVNGSKFSIIIYREPMERAVGEPVPGAEIFVEQEPSDIPIFNMGAPKSGADKATVEAFNGENLVFYKEDIPMSNERLYIGYVKQQVTYLGVEATFEKGHLHPDHNPRLREGIRFPDPVPWYWEEQGVNNLLVTCIRLVAKYTAYNETPKMRQSKEFSRGIERFNKTAMHAEENTPPSVPTIDGPASGKVGAEYNYTLKAVDLENDIIYYLIDWSDGSNIIVVGPYSSGVQVIASHTWTVEGTYTIKVKAMDEHYFESEWAMLEVTIPRNRATTNTMWYHWFLERFSLLEKLLVLFR